MSQKEDKVRVNARVPKNLYDWICSMYDNTSQAINEGLELLRESKAVDCHTNVHSVCQNDIQKHVEEYSVCQDVIREHTPQGEEVAPGQKAKIEELNSQIQAYCDQLHKKDEQIKTLEESLRKAPDPIELAQMRKRSEELEKQIKNLEESLRKAPDLLEFSRLQDRSEELEKHNQTLKAALEKASQREEDLKTMYNNYMLQVQSLINQKAIEAPGIKKPWWKFWKA